MTETKHNLIFEQAEELIIKWLEVKRGELATVLLNNSFNLNFSGSWSLEKESDDLVTLRRNRTQLEGGSYVSELGYKIRVSVLRVMDKENSSPGNIVMKPVRKLVIEGVLHKIDGIRAPDQELTADSTVGNNETGHELPSSATPSKRGSKRKPRR